MPASERNSADGCGARTANAKALHGASVDGRARSYDVTTSRRVRSQTEFRVSLVRYEERYRGPGNVDVESKVLSRSAVKFSLNLAVEDLLRKVQEEAWT